MKKKDKESIVNEEFVSEEQDNNSACCNQTDDSEEGCNGDECCCESPGADTLELQQRLDEAESKRDEYLSMAQRVQADFDNFRRRNKNALADSYKAATADVVEILLPVLDNLERALGSIVETGTQESFVKGIEMVQRQFVDCLEKLGVVEIEAMGQPFDPKFHEAIMQVEAKEGQEENTVAGVIQKGYGMNDKVIRYSIVHVVK